MKPRKNFRTRPKKLGAKKRAKVLAQGRRLVALGCEKEKVDKLNTVEIRDLYKKMAKKKAGKSTVKKTKAKTQKATK